MFDDDFELDDFKEPNITRRSVRRLMQEPKVNNFWGAVIAAGASLYGGMKQREQANRMAKRANKYYKKAGKSYALLGGMAEEWTQRYKDIYAPIEAGLAEKVQQGPDIEGVAGRAATDVALAYDKAEDIEARRQQRYGIDPSMGRARSDMDRARTEVMAKQQAYTEEEDRDWARKMTFTQMGRGLEAGAASAHAQAGSAYQSMGGSFLGRSAEAAKSAGSLFGTFGKYAGQAIDAYQGYSGGGGDTGGGDYGITDPDAYETTGYGESIYADED